MRQVSLYIHIPFCIKKCAYCDFLSFPAKEQVMRSYVALLCKEIEQKSELVNPCEVVSVFIGGGTPSCIPADCIKEILDAVKGTFNLAPGAEITMEMNPGTVDEKALAIYRSIGINRLSIGLQSTHDVLLKKLSRIHTYERFLETYRLVREAGFTNVNVDLMSALPGQNKEMFLETLHQVAKLSPEHISCYSLILEEGTPLYEEKDNLQFPDEEEDREMYRLTKEILKSYGYSRYEISNYAKEGYESVHNVGYWKRREYLGLGLGAASLIAETRFNNPEEMTTYEKMVSQRKWRENLVDYEELSEKACMEEFMFLGLRMMDGISKEVFENRFKVSFDSVYKEEVSQLKKDGLLTENESVIALTEKGIDVSNYAFSYFLF